MFTDFIEIDINTFCTDEVECIGHECDHPQIIALTNYLQHGVEINAISDQGFNIDVTLIPEEPFKNNKFRAKLLFVPGHYDALYS